MSENAIIIKRKSADAIAREAADKAKEYPDLNTEVFTKVYTEAYEEGYVEGHAMGVARGQALMLKKLTELGQTPEQLCETFEMTRIELDTLLAMEL